MLACLVQAELTRYSQFFPEQACRSLNVSYIQRLGIPSQARDSDVAEPDGESSHHQIKNTTTR